jgi:hypothetical protein
MRTAKSLLLDFFRGRVVPNINLRGLDRAIIFTAVGQRILFRQCAIRYKKSGSKVRARARGAAAAAPGGHVARPLTTAAVACSFRAWS